MMSEFERQKRVIDMMITGHSILRDRYNRLSSFFENGLIIASAILNSFVFIDEDFIERIIYLNSDIQRSVIGVASVVVFAISIVLLQVKWKEKASSHADAANALFKLLHDYREVAGMVDGPEKNTCITNFNGKYAQVTSSIVKIPDKYFNWLKLRHYRKLELSKMIDKYPNSNLFFLKVRQLFSSFKEKV